MDSNFFIFNKKKAWLFFLLLLYQAGCLWLQNPNDPSENLSGMLHSKPLSALPFCFFTLFLFYLFSKRWISSKALLAACLMEGAGVLIPYRQHGWRDEHLLLCLSGWILYLYGWWKSPSSICRQGVFFLALLAVMVCGWSGNITLAGELVFFDGVLLWLAAIQEDIT